VPDLKRDAALGATAAANEKCGRFKVRSGATL
jgi:hypothetical protein